MLARNVFLARQSVLIEDLVLSAADETWVSLNAGDQAVAVSGDGESGEWPEGGFTALGTHGGRALESNHSLWVASLQELVGPVASMDTLIVDESRLTRGLNGLTESTLQEGRGALVTHRVDSESVLASRGGEGHLVVLPLSTVHGPVVVAMIVHSAMAIEQETVLTLLQGQGA